MAMSSALSFRTLFALVPVLVLALLIANAVHVLDDSKANLAQFLDAAGFSKVTLATKADEEGQPSATAADWLTEKVEFLEKKLTLGRLGPVGVILLIWTSMTLLITIEQSLNRLFEAPRARGFGRRVVGYWAVVTLVPIVVSAAAYLATSASKALAPVPVLGIVVTVAGWVGNFIVGLIVLALVYQIMPNTTTRFRASLGGALVALPLWLVAKWAFGVYVLKFVGSGSLYATLGLLPLFLFWMNLSWLIFLFGGQLAYVLANLSRMEAAELAGKIIVGPTERLAGLLVVAREYLAGNGAVPVRQIVDQLALPEETVHKILDQLTAMGVLGIAGNVAKPAYVLLRPPEKIVVLEIMKVLPPDDVPLSPGLDPQLAEAISRVRGRTRDALGQYHLADALCQR